MKGFFDFNNITLKSFVFPIIAIIILTILIVGEVSGDAQKFKCDVFTATVNNSNQQVSKVTIKDERFVDGTEVEVQICGENYQVKPVDK